ncbi:MAG: hypothetical protein ABR972_12465 [Acidimicrobiales bacterium]
MTYLNEDGRAEPPIAGDKTSTLLGSLERQRAIFAWKCGDWPRSASGRQSVPATATAPRARALGRMVDAILSEFGSCG